MTQFPNPMSRSTPEDQKLVREEAEAERKLRADAAAQASELGLQNQARIETAREDLSRRATGTTNYGQAVEQPVADYLARNASQADIARQQSLARGEGESAKAHLDRLAMDPNAALNRVAMEERTFRQTQHYAEREGAIRQYLARGAGNVQDPNLQRLASEFVMSYPREYMAIKAEMRGGGPRETIPFDSELMAQIESESPAAVPGQHPSGLSQQEINRAKIAATRNPDQYQKFYDAADAAKERGDERPKDVIAAEMYNNQLRRDRGLDRETRQAARAQQGLALAARDILRRNAGNPDALNRAMQNYNSRNPEMPLRPEDLGLPSGDSGVVARPGDIVEADSLAGLNPNKVGIGAIISTPEGLSEIRSIGSGKKGGVPVLQDSNSGFFFVDPDATLSDGITPAYPDMESYNKALTRNDRIKFRRAILNSGNSIYAVEQRRLDAARDIASKHVIDEVRKAGLEAVAQQEAEFHYRYITEEAALTGMSTGQRSIEEIPDRQQGRGEPTIKVPSRGEVRKLAAELRSQPMSQYRDMSENELFDIAARQLMEDQLPYDSAMPQYEYEQMDGGQPSGSGQPAGEAGRPAGEVGKITGETASAVAEKADERGGEYAAKFDKDFDSFMAAVEAGDTLRVSASYDGHRIFKQFFRDYGILGNRAEREFRVWWEDNYPNRPFYPVDEGHGQTYEG